jgi:acyl-CoA thioesterase
MGNKPTPLSSLLRRARSSEPGRSVLAVPEDWMQGRSVFGGLQIAHVLQTMRSLVPRTPLRTLQATFFSPVAGELTAEALILRTGKNTVHVQGRLVDGGATAALVVGVFGAGRPSVVTVAPERPAVPPSDAPKLPFLPGITPIFMQHFEARWLQGSPPFAGDTGSRAMVVDLTLLDEGPATEEHLAVIADFVPPVALSHLTSPTPGSTLTWMLEIIGPGLASSLRGWRVDAELVAATEGYTSQSSMIWGPDGRLAATSHQSMLVFG